MIFSTVTDGLRRRDSRMSRPGLRPGTGITIAWEKAFCAGNLRECPCPPDHNGAGGAFEAMKEMGDVRAMFFGHDHTKIF